ncbi:MAG: hypothetical protein COB38_00805 [Gammaproteobacteria bacterium]|nr:MAG: hypothetical protein COB38_00805 [Gammaproteobacteria bacterium]
MRIKYLLITSLLFLNGCAMMKDYVVSSNSNASKIVIQRDLETPVLGSTTYIYEVNNQRNCSGDSSEADTRFMVLDKGNPLVSEFNSSGVNIKPNKLISLLFHTVAGFSQCTVIVSFMPEDGDDYNLQLLGRVGTYKANICMVELSSTGKDSKIIKRRSFTAYKACNT